MLLRMETGFICYQGNFKDLGGRKRMDLRRIKQKYFTYLVTRQALKVGERLRVNGKSWVTGKTILGNYVNFNGMEIMGGGS